MKRWNGLSQEDINSKINSAFKGAYDQEQGLIKDAAQRAPSAQM